MLCCAAAHTCVSGPRLAGTRGFCWPGPELSREHKPKKILKGTVSRGDDSFGALWRPQAALLPYRGHRKGPRPQWPFHRSRGHLQSPHQPRYREPEARARCILARCRRTVFFPCGQAGGEISRDCAAFRAHSSLSKLHSPVGVQTVSIVLHTVADGGPCVLLLSAH